MRELEGGSLVWFSRGMPFGAGGMLCRTRLPSTDLKIAAIRIVDCIHPGASIAPGNNRFMRKNTEESAAMPVRMQTTVNGSCLQREDNCDA